jgi:hypothetical protein
MDNGPKVLDYQGRPKRRRWIFALPEAGRMALAAAGAALVGVLAEAVLLGRFYKPGGTESVDWAVDRLAFVIFVMLPVLGIFCGYASVQAWCAKGVERRRAVWSWGLLLLAAGMFAGFLVWWKR